MSDNYSPSWADSEPREVSEHPKSGMEYLPSREVAMLLGLCQPTVRKMIEDGRLDGYREPGATGRWMATKPSVEILTTKRRKRLGYAKAVTPTDHYVTTTKAGIYLRRERSTVIEMMKRGDLIGYKEPGPKGRWMISTRSIEEYLESCIALTAWRLAREQGKGKR